MTDMRAVIVPKSDQLNADDLIAGPRTITIRDIKIKEGEQPVSIFFEGDNGKPWKCCKSMARVLVTAWGPDAKQYIGRSVTLYRDPTVKWAGMEVGGIRISHMSHIERDIAMALTETRGKRAPFRVRVLETPQPEATAPRFELIDGNGDRREYQSLKPYLDGLRQAVTEAHDKGAVWSDNAKAFGEALDRARAAGAAKSVTAMEALQADINAVLAG